MKTTLMVAACFACTCNASELSPAYVWYDRPWDIRYILMTDTADTIRSHIPVAHQKNIDILKGKIKAVYLTPGDLFPVHREFPLPDTPAMGLQVIEFERDGTVITPNLASVPLVAKRSMIERLVLVVKGAENSNYLPFRLAEWSFVPGADHVSPAVCEAMDAHRYLAKWNPETSGTNFGCREWTAQLYNENRPYIDITSYARHGKQIGSIIGWSRFQDRPKPVIGQEGKMWLCLHECPLGEQPGVIPDIKAWAKKHGFPVPKRPKKQPEFPDSDFKDAHLE